MTDRTAHFLVCDDVLVSMNGKLTALGIYGSNIIIPSDPSPVPQLVVLFQIETPSSRPFQKLTLQILLPGEQAPRTMDIPQLVPIQFGPFISAPLGQPKLRVMWPFLLSQVTLKSGTIEIKVIHEEGEINAGTTGILTQTQAARALLNPSLA